MINHVAMLSVHTCPLATLGGKETGGMNVYVKELTTALDKQGVVVDVFTRSQEPGTPTVHGVLGQRSRVIHVKAGPEIPYNKNKVYDHLPEFIQGVQVRATQEKRQYDVIHSHYWLSGVVARNLQCIWGGIPTVQMFHTLGEMKNSVAQTTKEHEIPLRIDMEGQIVQFADRLVAATPLERNQLMEFYDGQADTIDVVPPGVNLDLFRPLRRQEALKMINAPQDRLMILFVGRLQPLKGIDTLIRAMSVVLNRHPELREKICISIISGIPQPDSGSEWDELQKLRHLQKSLGVEDVTTFLGTQDQDRLVHYYSAAHLVVMPSHYESFGLVAVEAMACGTPVIASKVGGLTYTIEDGVNGYLVPKKDYEAMADKIALLLKDEALQRQLGQQARQSVQRFGWHKIATQILDVYDRARHEKNRVPC